ncbi:MAG: HAMP domain-containing protein, partial [Gammaproteobacteria bacterium]
MVNKSKFKLAGGMGGSANFISNLSVRAKILSGFAIVLAIMAVVAVNSYYSFTQVASGLGHYTEAAEEAALAAKIETNFLKLQGYVREYANSGDPKQVELVEETAPKLQKSLDAARKVVHDPKHMETLDEVAREFGDYMSMFTQMRAVKAEHDQLVTGTLFPESEKMVKDLEEIVKHHATSEDSVTLLAKTAHEHAQLLALYAQMMKTQTNEEFGAKVRAEFVAFGNSIEALKRRVINPEDSRLVTEVETLFADFKKTFEKAHKDEVIIYDLSHKAMAEKADVIIKDTEYLEAAAAETEHMIRAETGSTVVASEIVIAAVGIVGFGVGLAFAFFLGRMISNPIRDVTDMMNEIAQGNTDVQITGTEQNDEIGAMKRALVELRKAVADSYELGQMVEDMPVNVMKCDLDDFKINYMNKATRETLKTLEHILPVKVDQMIGQSIDIFHKHPEHQRNMLRDPSNLPHKANITVGDQTLSLNVTAIRDKAGNYVGPMLGWSVITEQLALSEKVLNVVKNVSAAATEMRSAAESMTSTAESTSKQATAVAAASE